ncbi:MAG: SGNH/GDSL hydrolase family protein, partial [Pseudomonadota bacterium]|nr:SGNH/GDSL hydrolase family protein [Pseudomonadota bacterium]
PNLRARIRHEGGGYFIRCNELGFRCNYRASNPKPEDRFRILLFGDSYTAGDGVSNAYRFGEQLERIIPDVQVLNFGLPASGVDQQYLTFLEFAKDIDSDLLLVCPMVDNIRRNLLTHQLTHSIFEDQLTMRAKPYFLLRNNELILHHSPVPKTMEEYNSSETILPSNGKGDFFRHTLRTIVSEIDQKVPGFRGFTQRLRKLALPEEYNDPQSPAWLLMKAILVQWIKESSAKIILCPLPTFEHINGNIQATSYLQRFKELSQEHNIEFIDVLPIFFKKKQNRASYRFSTDEHPNQLCHTLIADALSSHVNKYVQAWKLK